MGVDIVAFFYIAQNVGVISLHTLAFQLIITAAGTHFGRGGDENLQLSIRKHYGTDVATIHHNSFILAHLLLLRYHGGAHKW